MVTLWSRFWLTNPSPSLVTSKGQIAGLLQWGTNQGFLAIAGVLSVDLLINFMHAKHRSSKAIIRRFNAHQNGWP